MLERLALAAAFDQRTELFGFGGRERALEVQVEFHARQLEQIGEERFGLEPRRFDPFFRQKSRAFLNALKHRHAQQCKKKTAAAKLKVGRNSRARVTSG